MIEVRESPIHGLGVFATRDIAAEETIERAPCLLLKDSDFTKHSDLKKRYVFGHRDGSGKSVLALGYGTLYNEDTENPNVVVYIDDNPRFFLFVAKRDIKSGDELCINYFRGTPANKERP